MRRHRRYRESKADRKRQREEQKKIRARRKTFRRKLKHQERREFRQRLAAFRANPLSFFHPTTSRTKQERAVRKRIRREKLLKFADFLRNPAKAIFKSRPLREERRRLRQLARIHRREERKRSKAEANLAWNEIRTSGELRMRFFREMLQSSAWCLLAALITYIAYQAVTIIVAGAYQIPVIWQYNRLTYPLYTWSPLYTRQALVVIFASGPVICMLLALLGIGLFFRSKQSKIKYHNFFLWLFIHGINMFFGSYISGILTRTEFVYASEWLFLSNPFDIEELIFGIISLATLVLTGRLVSVMFLLSSGSVTLVQPKYRQFFSISAIFIPWITLVIVFFLITLPDYYVPLIIKTLTPGFIVIPAVLAAGSAKYESIHDSGLIRRRTFRWSIIILAAALLFFYRVIFNWGIRFE